MPPVSHGYTRRNGNKTPEYRTWQGIKARCLKPTEQSYPRYGGRGIGICERWLDFANFLSDMGLRPSPQHSVDRIDNNKGYEPGNCKWATRSEQQRNRRDSRIITFKGQSGTLAYWSEVTGIKAVTLGGRLAWGWTVEEMLTTPVDGISKWDGIKLSHRLQAAQLEAPELKQIP